jgi:hypothetical protein
VSGSRGLAACVVLAAIGCTLPDFEKVEDTSGPSTRPDSGTDGEQTPSCPMDIGFTGACRKCVAENCCAQARACDGDKCGKNITMPIAPVTTVTDTFDALAQCVLDNCDMEDSCNLSWGCVDNYRIPTQRNGSTFRMRVFNYADPNMIGLPNISVTLCESADPSCVDGMVNTVSTDGNGEADFTVDRNFSGYFLLEGGPPQAATVAWSEPIYNVIERFNHQALAERAVQGLAVSSGIHTALDQPFKEGTGHLIARMQNCLPMKYLEGDDLDSRARDVEFTFSPQAGASQIFYIDAQAMLDKTLTRTSSRGYAGVFEVQATQVTVIAKHADTGKQLARAIIPLREDTIGYVYLIPQVRD